MKKPIRALAALTLALTAAAIMPATSFARACMDANEQTAERGIRLHSELMVVALTCRDERGQSLGQAYTSFTQQNLASVKAWEASLIRFYGAAGAGNPTRQLDDLRTRLANEVSMAAARETPPTFCARRVRLLQMAPTWSPAMLSQYLGAAAVVATVGSDYPACPFATKGRG